MQFTPELVEKYNEIKANGYKFEIIYVSENAKEENANKDYEQMPWLMLSYSVTAEVKKKLVERFQFFGFPSLVLLDEQGNLINTSGRFSIFEQDFPDWGEYDEES
jgi:hypothetical protein